MCCSLVNSEQPVLEGQRCAQPAQEGLNPNVDASLWPPLPSSVLSCFLGMLTLPLGFGTSSPPPTRCLRDLDTGSFYVHPILLLATGRAKPGP